MLRLSTTDRREFRFWLTRRYAALLFKALQQVATADPHVQAQTSAPARSAMLDFQRESALNAGNFEKPFEDEGTALPLGETPVLLAKAQVRRAKDGGHRLRMDPMEGNGIELPLNPTVVHSLRKLLVDVANKADWALVLESPTPSAQAPPRQQAH